MNDTTKNYPWSVPTTEEKWHTHAEGVLMVALTTLNLPVEAWKSARLLRAVPNCRLVLMLAHHMLSPALSVEETGLTAYLQTPPEAGPSVVQVSYFWTAEWKCAGRRLVEIGGRLPTATQLHPVFHQDTHQAFGIEQEGEVCVSAEVKHHTHDEPESNGDCGALLICGSDTDTVCDSSGTLPGSCSVLGPKRENSSLSTSIEEPAREEISADTNIRSVMMEDLFL